MILPPQLPRTLLGRCDLQHFRVTTILQAGTIEHDMAKRAATHRMPSSMTARVYGSLAMCSYGTPAASSQGNASTSASSFASTSGWRARAAMANVSAVDVVSYPAAAVRASRFARQSEQL